MFPEWINFLFELTDALLFFLEKSAEFDASSRRQKAYEPNVENLLHSLNRTLQQHNAFCVPLLWFCAWKDVLWT